MLDLVTRPLVVQLLTMLFNLCLAIGYTPSSFTQGITIPLLKSNNVDKTKVENYRGVTLSCIISKVFEMCLQTLFGTIFNCDDLQFGFKKTN
jgi:hypothetical protein